MKKIFFIFSLIILFLMSGCKPGYYPCDAPPQVSVDTVNGIFEGETLYLKSTATAGSSFQWSGPNGFSSTEQNPVISNVSLDREGVYKVTANKDGCASSAKFELKVALKPPCIPAANTITFNNNTYTLSNIKVTVNANNGNLTVTAKHSGSTSGSITISPLVPNKTNVYLLEQNGPDFNEVNVSFYEGGAGYNWMGADGKAYVRMVNGKPEITICNATFTSYSFPSRKLTGKIVVP